ncbi:hypothetical protein HAT86_01130 [Roseovarius gahaiensis]|uniref:Uncharacterized protein n=1 Tax=Roseovarius gahaiensis TaxID=2716691 RepID=A0A967EIL7_9RHOB|nr:hypothetical protein [Roseovarius gahaiensis]NHQ73067.1 hypothetical protein [Roseovarius gahaiensis]
MSKKHKQVMGIDAAPPRPTVLAAFLLAVLVSVPVGGALWLLEWLGAI